MKLRLLAISCLFVALVLVLTGAMGTQIPLWPDSRPASSVIDVSNPTAPSKVRFVSSFDTPGNALDVAVVGGYAYVADGDEGLRIIDVTSPAAPAELGAFDTPDHAAGVVVAGGYAYVAAHGALHIIDVTNPAAPSLAYSFNTPGWAEDVAVAGGYAYVADGDEGLRIIDVTNLAVPTETGALDTPGSAMAVTVVGSYAYVADRWGGLRIIDVSNPVAPSETGAFDTAGDTLGVAVAGGYAYVADGEGGLRIIDVANPVAPSEAGSFDTPGWAGGVAVMGGYAYVADGEGLRIIDVTDPAAPSEADSFDMPGRWAEDVAVAEGYTYVADFESGLVILRYTESDATPSPNSTITPSPSPTPSAIPTRTSTPPRITPNTPTRTSTPTPSPSSTRTLAPTYTPPTSTPTRSPGDGFEPDNTCATSNAILPDGDPQAHTFHTPSDPDWVRFQVAAGTNYIISALAIGANAHPTIRLYGQCDQAPIDSSDTFGYDQIIAFRAERNGLYYLKFTHLGEKAYGDDTAYQISVRPGTTGAAIIAGGRLYRNDDLQQQITFMTDRAYHIFQQAGYDPDTIYYTSADPNPPPGMDAPSLPGNLRYALQTWAPRQIQDGDPLFLYLADHGENEFFFLDTGAHKVTPDDLDAWLLVFENQRPNSPVVIIIEACRAGSFITPLGTISKPGRVIVTAADENTDAFVKPPGQGGGYFSDAFFGALAQSYDLWQSYQIARKTVREVGRDMRFVQRPWIDGNGNGLPYPHDPADEGAGRSLGLGGVAGLSGQAPFIEQPDIPQPDEDIPVLIQVKVLDENPEGATVWMEVTKPSTPPPSAPPGYITPISHAEREELTYNPTTGKFETQFAFDETGAYQFVFNAEDAGGQRAQAVSAHVLQTNEAPVYLPLLARR